MIKKNRLILLILAISVILRIATWNAPTPGYAKIFTEHGLKAQDDQKTDDAINFYKKAITHDPNFPDPWLYSALIYQKQNNLTKALNYFKKITTLNPIEKKFGVAYYEFGKDLLQKNKIPDAIDYLKTSFDIDPSRVETSYALANAYILINNKEMAQDKLKLLDNCSRANTECRLKVTPWIIELKEKLNEKK